MTVSPKMRSLDEVRHQLAWSAYKLAALIGKDVQFIYRNLVDGDGKPVDKVRELPADAHVWVNLAGVLLPGRRNHNGNLTFIACHVLKALEDAGVAIFPPPP